jgi:hypothetical protein
MTGLKDHGLLGVELATFTTYGARLGGVARIVTKSCRAVSMNETVGTVVAGLSGACATHYDKETSDAVGGENFHPVADGGFEWAITSSVAPCGGTGRMSVDKSGGGACSPSIRRRISPGPPSSRLMRIAVQTRVWCSTVRAERGLLHRDGGFAGPNGVVTATRGGHARFRVAEHLPARGQTLQPRSHRCNVCAAQWQQAP